MLLPILIVAFKDFGGILYVMYSILMILLLPVIPLGIGTIAIMILMKVTNIQGKKDLLRNLSMFLLLFIVIGMQMAINKLVVTIEPGKEGEFLSNLLQKSDGMMVFIGKAYPPAIWFSKSMSNSHNLWGFAYTLLNILLAIGMVYLIGLIGSKIYLKALLEKSNHKKSQKKVELTSMIRSKPQAIAIFLNDVKLVLRTPIYLFNCVSITFLLPILLVVLPLMTGGEEIDFGEIFVYFNDFINLALIALFGFMATTNPTASTTFSREGKAYWITKVLPMSPGSIFIGRLLQPIILEFLAIIFMLLALQLALPLSLSQMFLTLLVGLIVSLPILAVGVLIDKINPKLDWDEPQKAVKQNFNVVFNMLLGVGYILLLGFISMQLVKLEFSIGLIYGFISIVSVLLTSGLFWMFSRVK